MKMPKSLGPSENKYSIIYLAFSAKPQFITTYLTFELLGVVQKIVYFYLPYFFCYISNQRLYTKANSWM